MSFEAYKKDVMKAMDEWIESIKNESKYQASLKKSQAEELIQSWKKVHPNRLSDIHNAVAKKL